MAELSVLHHKILLSCPLTFLSILLGPPLPLLSPLLRVLLVMLNLLRPLAAIVVSEPPIILPRPLYEMPLYGKSVSFVSRIEKFFAPPLSLDSQLAVSTC